MSAVFLSWYGVSSVGRSSVTARWSHVVRLWSHSTVHQVLVGWVDTLIAVADGAGTVALLEALLLGGHTWQVVCISWCFKSRDFSMAAILSWRDG